MVLPESPPKGLSPRSYCRMALQYHLMGNARPAIKAGRLALEGDRDDFAGTPFENLTEADFSLLRRLLENLDEGVSFTGRFLGGSRLFLSGLKCRLMDGGDRADAFLENIPLLSSLRYGVEEFINLLLGGAVASAGNLCHSVIVATHPSREIPEGLSAKEYLKLGKRYLSLHWPEQARDAFTKVIELSSDEAGLEAERLVSTRLPANPVPYLAVKRFIEARRKASLGRVAEARRAYEAIAGDYSDFEWPREQLAHILIQQGMVEEAIEALNELVTANPGYAPAYELLARAHAIKGEIFESQTALDRATVLAFNPDEISVLRQLITVISRL